MFEVRPYHHCHRNANEVYYDPFRAMAEMEKSFFSEPKDPFFGMPRMSQFRTDVRDLGDSYLLEADLPGFDKKDIQLELNGDTLTISAERRREQEEKDAKGFIRRERSFGAYCRSYDVSEVDTEGIRARYDNGVLSMTLPKKAAAIPASRTLEIE